MWLDIYHWMWIAKCECAALRTQFCMFVIFSLCHFISLTGWVCVLMPPPLLLLIFHSFIHIFHMNAQQPRSSLARAFRVAVVEKLWSERIASRQSEDVTHFSLIYSWNRRWLDPLVFQVEMFVVGNCMKYYLQSDSTLSLFGARLLLLPSSHSPCTNSDFTPAAGAPPFTPTHWFRLASAALLETFHHCISWARTHAHDPTRKSSMLFPSPPKILFIFVCKI